MAGGEEPTLPMTYQVPKNNPIGTHDNHHKGEQDTREFYTIPIDAHARHGGSFFMDRRADRALKGIQIYQPFAGDGYSSLVLLTRSREKDGSSMEGLFYILNGCLRLK